ncbi:hypothetical protein [Streptomyces sp. PA5.6]|uniref:hypothetical protein n=1 Tax=Streptomyces sp. PA5.6 TaxID=3035651 RepID=UPI003904B40E
MKYGDLLIVDELHRLDRVATDLLQSLIDRWLAQPARSRTPAEDELSETVGRLVAAGRPGPSRPHGGRPGRDSTPDRTPEMTPDQELRQFLLLDQITGAQARRGAELLELLDEEQVARNWWNLAAALGDADAIDYVELLQEEKALLTGEATQPQVPTTGSGAPNVPVPVSAGAQPRQLDHMTSACAEELFAMAASVRSAPDDPSELALRLGRARALEGLLGTAQRMARSTVATRQVDREMTWMPEGDALLASGGS